MSDELVQVNIGTEEERYPCLAIIQFGRFSSPGNSLDIPVEMFNRLTVAMRAVEEVECEIMKYVLAKYPQRGDVRDWLAERPDGTT